MDLQALNTELTTDPAGLGYATQDDVTAAETLNRVDRQADRENLKASLLAGALEMTDYEALAPAQRRYFDLLISAGEVDNTPTVRSQLRDLFPQGSATRQNIRAAMKRPGSRAEEIGLGRVTPSNVADARRL